MSIEAFFESILPEGGIPEKGPVRLVGDFETFYTAEYSLRKMTPLEYIHHALWGPIGCSMRIDTHSLDGAQDRPFTKRAKWINARQLPNLFALIGQRIGWHRTIWVSHNIGFDGAILAWRYGTKPALYMDTLGMGRVVVSPKTGRASLDACAKYFNLPPKESDVIVNAVGWTLRDFEADEAAGGQRYPAFRRYCNHDTDLCSSLLDRMAHVFPADERLLMDMVARMAIFPQFVLDRDVLVSHLDDVQKRKAILMDRLEGMGVLKDDLMSNDKLAKILERMGIDVPTKVSAKTKKQAWAFSKTDKAFTALLEHEDPDVQAIVAARLGVKSTLEETRTQRFIACADVQWSPTFERVCEPATASLPQLRKPLRMPFPLKYSGAHTHRLSGDWALNLQNLGRNSPLRRALAALFGYVVVSADASQIEARVVAWLAGCMKLVQAFRDKRDVYSEFATLVYEYAVNKRDNPGERFVGKTGVLGLGFGMGAPKFVVTCWNQGRAQGLSPALCTVPIELGTRVVSIYRTEYREVPTLWKVAERMIEAMVLGNDMDYTPPHLAGTLSEPVIRVRGQRIYLPNGMYLEYNDIRYEQVDSPWKPGTKMRQAVYKYGNETRYTFGGKIIENIVQALARIITMSAAVRLRRQSNFAFPLAGQVHDQLIYVAPKGEAEHVLDTVIEEMRKPLPWCPDIPLDAEGEIGANLYDAK